MVKRRCVLYLAGYEAIGVGWYRLLKRELRTFSGTWNVTAAISDVDYDLESWDTRAATLLTALGHESPASSISTATPVKGAA